MDFSATCFFLIIAYVRDVGASELPPTAPFARSPLTELGVFSVSPLEPMPQRTASGVPLCALLLALL